MSTPKSDRNAKTTREKGGRDPPDVTLDQIAEGLLSFLCLKKSEEQIKKKYDIKQEHEHNFWPEDGIKRAWEEIQRMDINSDKRKDWSVVIILQILKRSFVCPLCKLEKTKRKSKESSGQSNAEQEAAAQQKCPKYDTDPGCSQATGNSPGAPDVQDRPGEALQNEDENLYICIPFSELHDETRQAQPVAQPVAQPAQPVAQPVARYKLLDKLPSAKLPSAKLPSAKLPSAKNAVLKKTKSYTMSFNNTTKNAKWVYEILNKEILADNMKQIAFGGSYHRGHLAAVANHRWCREAHDDANLNSNIVPQHETLNNGPWKTAENRCRNLIKTQNRINNVHVYSGPLYLKPMNPEKIEEKTVPSGFFKVIIVENNDGTVEEPECYLMPNEDVTDYTLDSSKVLAKYKKSIKEIEEVSGLTFTKPRPKVTYTQTRKMELKGTDRKEELRTATIEVKLDYDIV